MPTDADEAAAKVRAAYQRRAGLGLDSRYAYWEPANLFIYQSRETAFLRVLRARGLVPLGGRRVLDVGCGEGGILHDLIRYGADPAALTGIDLLPERVRRAKEILPSAEIREADAQALPYDDATFDLTLGFTLLSSIQDEAPRARVAAEMARVTRSEGLVVVYDFWVNPFNRDIRSLKRDAVRNLFPGREIAFQSVTLAPPIVRLLAGRRGGWIMATILEVVPFLRTHFFAAIRI